MKSSFGSLTNSLSDIASFFSFPLFRDEIIALPKFKEGFRSFCNLFLFKLRKHLTKFLYKISDKGRKTYWYITIGIDVLLQFRY